MSTRSKITWTQAALDKAAAKKPAAAASRLPGARTPPPPPPPRPRPLYAQVSDFAYDDTRRLVVGNITEPQMVVVLYLLLSAFPHLKT